MPLIIAINVLLSLNLASTSLKSSGLTLLEVNNNPINEAVTEAKIEKVKTQQAADIAWENLQINHSGWRDDFFTIVLSIPAIMCFIPGLAPYVVAGFAALATCPGYYQWMLGIAVGAAFGYRKLADVMALKKGK